MYIYLEKNSVVGKLTDMCSSALWPDAGELQKQPHTQVCVHARCAHATELSRVVADLQACDVSQQTERGRDDDTCR